MNPHSLAVAEAGGREVDGGQQVVFDASGSYDPEGQSLLYPWDRIQGDPWSRELWYVSDSTVRYIQYDDYSGKLTVAVTDDKSAGVPRIVYDSADIRTNG